jgi:hypothetical protein
MAGDPDFCFLGFSLWIDGRQFPDSADYWDGNWLVVRARMEVNRACINCDGPILMTTDIEQFRDELATMVAALKGEASLTPLEPELRLLFKMHRRGRVEATIEITPDHLTQRHRFTVDVDQSYLPALVASCDAILARFPITNTAARG